MARTMLTIELNVDSNEAQLREVDTMTARATWQEWREEEAAALCWWRGGGLQGCFKEEEVVEEGRRRNNGGTLKL